MWKVQAMKTIETNSSHLELSEEEWNSHLLHLTTYDNIKAHRNKRKSKDELKEYIGI